MQVRFLSHQGIEPEMKHCNHAYFTSIYVYIYIYNAYIVRMGLSIHRVVVFVWVILWVVFVWNVKIGMVYIISQDYIFCYWSYASGAILCIFAHAQNTTVHVTV